MQEITREDILRCFSCETSKDLYMVNIKNKNDVNCGYLFGCKECIELLNKKRINLADYSNNEQAGD